MERREKQTAFTEVNDFSMIYRHDLKLNDKNKLKVIKRDKEIELCDPTIIYRHYLKFPKETVNVKDKTTKYHHYFMERRNVKTEENIYI